MKRKFVVIIVIVVAVAAGLLGWNAYYSSIDASNVPVTPINVASQGTAPISAELTVPVLGGLIEKPLSCVPGDDGAWRTLPRNAPQDAQASVTQLGTLGKLPYTLQVGLLDTMDWTVTLTLTDSTGASSVVYQGGTESSDSGQTSASGPWIGGIAIKKAGDYVLDLVGTLPDGGKNAPAGTIDYRSGFSVENPDPIFTAGRTDLQQGDILSLKLENVPDGVVPEIETGLGTAVFTKGEPLLPDGADEGPSVEGFSNWYAAIPVSNSRALGDYPVTVHVGDSDFETSVTVSAYDFTFQNMTIDTSIPSVAAATSSEAITQFNQKVTPLYSEFSDERYWDGLFAMPVTFVSGDFISTQFGEIRVTNGDPKSRRSHLGIDYAVSRGTPVHAGNAGKVLLAEFLLNTGNTVVIDHGGGLKSLYFHMDALTVSAGTMVAKGDQIGVVGSTGYSTGPHLHYEMRIGDQPINPAMLYDPGAGLYSAEAQPGQ